MKSSRHFYIALTSTVTLIVILWFSTSSGQSRKRYEVEAQVYSTPEYRTDATRAIEAYERLMTRYMDVTERNLTAISADIGAVAARLDAIDDNLSELDQRLERIERHLGILPAPAASIADPNTLSSEPAASGLPGQPPGQGYR